MMMMMDDEQQEAHKNMRYVSMMYVRGLHTCKTFLNLNFFYGERERERNPQNFVIFFFYIF